MNSGGSISSLEAEQGLCRQMLRAIRRWMARPRLLLEWALIFVACLVWASPNQAQTTNPGTGQAPLEPSKSQQAPCSLDTCDSLHAWEGLPVSSISFVGVPAGRIAPIPDQLDVKVGAPLTEKDLKESLRQLYGSDLFETLRVEGERQPGGLKLIFTGNPRMFIGTVGVYGATGATVNTQLERASQLDAGTRFTPAKMKRALDQMRATLEQNGYYQSKISQTITQNSGQQLANIEFRVISGPRARVGHVVVTGDSGMKQEEFCRYAHLRSGHYMDPDTVNHALDGVLRAYQHQSRLEAEIKLQSQTFDPKTNTVNLRFSANRGPIVTVQVEGASLDPDRITRLIPIFEEGSVDEDLLNEGNRRMRDYFQRLGYFEAKVEHQQGNAGGNNMTIVFRVHLGPRSRVEKVAIVGNHYFDTATLKDLISVRAADVIDHHGVYSQALVTADVSTLESVYKNNGFADVSVRAETSTRESVAATNSLLQSGAVQRPSAIGAVAPLIVTYRITEGKQMRVGTMRIEGNDHVATDTLSRLLNTVPGQLFSPRNLSLDHDAILTEYYARGFDQANVNIAQQPEASDPTRMDVVFNIEEGKQIFVRNVLLTGLQFTRPDTVQRAITVHAGDPLNQSALSETQRNLYSLALFNEVNTAIENPTGDATRKTVLLQLAEARRWTVTYGFGFEAQTGQPQNNCAGAFAAGVKCSPNGKTGVSPRVLANITRNGLFGRPQSASLTGTYGLLEQSVGIQYEIPHFEVNPNFGFTFSGGYANSQDVSTYVASRLEGAFRISESFNRPGSWISRANTFIYEIDFRRVKVAASSLQVYSGAISQLSTATRVGGPGFTWIRDTRDVPMDARRGTYTTFQEFLSDRLFGAQAEFNRIDTSNSSYYTFDKERFVLARNTRYAQIRSFGSGSSGLIPLPERLYAGGPVSLRGFSQNAAGPRDPETGYQIGGAGALTNSTELRLPPPTLPWFGNTISFVLFHDMGNVFTNAGDAWASFLRVRQPDSEACRKAVANTSNPASYDPAGTGPVTSTGQQGPCKFNDFSHALGVGLRYHTPVGPIRFDVSYNLNPPIYPVNVNYGIPTPAPNPLNIPGYEQGPYLGQAPHINFFFSLGQAF